MKDMKNILITIISTVILSITLTGCYNCEDDGYYRVRMVHELETLPPVVKDGSQIELRGETEMDGYTLFFELCANESFDGNTYSINRLNLDDDDWKIKTATVGYEFTGTYYYRLCATYGDDTIYAENVESFTIENPLKTLPPTDISTNGARLHATSTFDFDSNAHLLYFLVSNTLDFSDYQRYDCQSIYNDEDGITEYSYLVDNLVPATSYYCKFVAYFLLGTTVESNTVEFTTAENPDVPLQIGDIYGYKLNEYGEEVRITDDLKVVAFNSETGQFQGPSIATFDANGNYVWKENNIILEEGYNYFVWAFQDNITKWGSGGLITYLDGDYSMGGNKNPIYFGADFGISSENPYAKIQLTDWTCQVVVSYPAEWGEHTSPLIMTDIYDKAVLPGSHYYINGDDIKCEDWGNIYWGGNNGLRLSNDNTRYEYRFNIWHTNIPEGYVTLSGEFAKGALNIPCPQMSLSQGGIYHLDLYGVDLDNVTVKPWVEKNGGEIIINPTN